MQIQGKLGQELDANRKAFSKALTLTICTQPPGGWRKYLGPSPTEEEMGSLLDADSKAAFASSGNFCEEIEGKLAFVDVTSGFSDCAR